MRVLDSLSVFYYRFIFTIIWLLLAPIIFFPLDFPFRFASEALAIHKGISSIHWKESLLLDSPIGTTGDWEVAQVRFITPCRYRRDLSEHDYHILELTRPSENSKLTIHLMKKPTFASPDLRVVVQDGNSKPIEESFSANASAYSGEVTSKHGNETIRGRAALTVCNENGGFCGLIVTDKEHLIIQPHPAGSFDAGQDSAEVSTEHLIRRVDDSIQTSTCTATDEIRVPMEKLKAAAALAAQDAVSSNKGPWRDDSSSLSSSLLTPLIPGPRDAYTSVDTLLSTGSSDFWSGPSGREKLSSRSSSGKKAVEIAVFTDEDLYNRLRKKYPKDTVKRIKDYVITMINTMDLLYQHNSLGTGLEFRLVHLEIMKHYPSKLNKNNGRAMKYLSSFCDFAGEKNVNGDMWDHALLLTGIDLREDETSATAGLAWAGTMCYRYYSCSISEGHSFGAAYIITHEIGHSLGMEHDGYGVSKSCDKDKYIMSPTTGPGKVEWSPCSRQNLQDFLKYGASELRNSNTDHRPVCLSQSAMRSSNRIETTDGGRLPGQKFDASQQCKLAVGLQFRPVLRKSEPPFDNICWMLYCGNGTHAISTHPALEGTKCDDTKHCSFGKCVTKT
ncbi:unnamed protein product [Allacma fusca]|uniref:Peptidase M12B domain-containing protein n=1 Tax=Allacma fusca TaxID=39272 RepID=A0A8J2NSB9_9HEXA|nr:unnamed protein product [Allacma fusca]